MSYIPKPYLTSNELIKSAVRRAGIPRSQSLFTDDDFLAFGNEEMDTGLSPSIVQLHQDYFLQSDDIPLTTTTNRYSIPTRAIGNKLRDVSYVQQGTNNVVEMFRISIDNVSDYNLNSNYNSNIGFYYYVENNQIVLLAQASGLPTGFLRMSYYMRPNRLVLLKDVGIITNIDLTTGQIVMSSVPVDFSVQQLFDFISVNSPHRTLAKDLTATGLSVGTNTVVFNIADIPSGLNIGDHVCIAQTAAIPQVPSDLHVVLAHRIAARCLEAMGDAEGLQAANVKLAELELKTQVLIDDRVEASPEKIIARHGALRRGLTSQRNRYRS